MGRLHLHQYAFLPDYGTQIEALFQLARPERWDYLSTPQDKPHKILLNYINHTFKRLWDLNVACPDRNYLFISEQFFCFNTGLFTRNFEPIFALFEPNESERSAKWKLKGFFKKSAWELRTIGKLPERASYFDDFKDLIFDTRLDIRINIDHILDDEKNRARIPEQYRNVPNLPMLFLGYALEYAKIRIKENYKAAVPQYFKGKIQFLIPISLGSPDVVDLSLAVGRNGDIYTGHTCLTLDMAYNNARLIAKPESDWLVGTPAFPVIPTK